MPRPVVLSHFQVRPLLAARRAGASVASTSLDLGLTMTQVALSGDGLVLPGGERLGWTVVEEIAAQEAGCFVVRGQSAEKIQCFSDALQRFYSLMPTEGAPTLILAGFPMHRIKGIDPQADTRRKVRAVAPVRGRVLDTSTGLGYTAIEAARTARRVVTTELDPAVLEIARLNPWSRGLFANPRIKQVIADAFEHIQTLPDRAFARILHDPPTLSLAGELYSGDFYRHAHRVLASGGRMFHYIGDPGSRSGARVTAGVVRRLKDAGFVRVVRQPEAFGVVAYKTS